MWNKIQIALIIFNCLLLVIFISILGFYYRLVPEDYYAVLGNHQYGPWKQALVICNQWGGRFFSYLFSFVLLHLYGKGFSYWLYFLAGNTLLLVSFFSVVSFTGKRYTLLLTAPEKIAVSCLAFITLFYLTPGIRESWFWVAASTSYYWGLVMAVSGAALLIRTKIKWFHVLFSSCCFFYACSASEPFALMILCMFIVFGLIFSFRCGPYRSIPLVIVFASAIAGFLIMYLAKGTTDRWLAMPDLTLFTKAERCGGAVIKYFIYWFPSKFLISFLFAPLLFTIGYYLQSKRNVFFQYRFFKVTVILFSAYVIIIFFSFLPSCYVMGEAGPVRSWHHTGLYNLFFSFILFIYLGYHYGPRLKLSKMVVVTYLFLITGFHFIFLINQLSIARQYAVSVDKRIALLSELQTRHFKGLLTLEKLPDSGYLFSAEIGEDKDHYLNKFLKQGLKLEYDICVRK